MRILQPLPHGLASGIAQSAIGETRLADSFVNFVKTVLGPASCMGFEFLTEANSLEQEIGVVDIVVKRFLRATKIARDVEHHNQMCAIT